MKQQTEESDRADYSESNYDAFSGYGERLFTAGTKHMLSPKFFVWNVTEFVLPILLVSSFFFAFFLMLHCLPPLHSCFFSFHLPLITPPLSHACDSDALTK